MPDKQKTNLGKTEGRMLLTVAQVAYLLKLSERTVWRLASTGEIPKPISLGGSRRWLLSRIAEHIEKLAGERIHKSQTDSGN